MAARWKRLWESKFFLCECSKCIAEGSLPAAGGDATPDTVSDGPAGGSTVALLRPFTAAWFETAPNSIRFECTEMSIPR